MRLEDLRPRCSVRGVHPDGLVTVIERGLRFEPTDREFEKLGYDLESRDPDSGRLRFHRGQGTPERRRYHHRDAERDSLLAEQSRTISSSPSSSSVTTTPTASATSGGRSSGSRTSALRASTTRWRNCWRGRRSRDSAGRLDGIRCEGGGHGVVAAAGGRRECRQYSSEA